ncbi:hypothetical protein [Algicola sagamiensis]|uniref:hypothetical protein n=1 Tax=Algicola sagamiensis TaxID=163869 RepID=UPI0003692BEB|nr:hypothetical protein [Algicola sagamiensis]
METKSFKTNLLTRALIAAVPACAMAYSTVASAVEISSPKLDNGRTAYEAQVGSVFSFTLEIENTENLKDQANQAKAWSDLPANRTVAVYKVEEDNEIELADDQFNAVLGANDINITLSDKLASNAANYKVVISATENNSDTVYTTDASIQLVAAKKPEVAAPTSVDLTVAYDEVKKQSVTTLTRPRLADEGTEENKLKVWFSLDSKDWIEFNEDNSVLSLPGNYEGRKTPIFWKVQDLSGNEAVKHFVYNITDAKPVLVEEGAVRKLNASSYYSVVSNLDLNRATSGYLYGIDAADGVDNLIPTLIHGEDTANGIKLKDIIDADMPAPIVHNETLFWQVTDSVKQSKRLASDKNVFAPIATFLSPALRIDRNIQDAGLRQAVRLYFTDKIDFTNDSIVRVRVSYPGTARQSYIETIELNSQLTTEDNANTADSINNDNGLEHFVEVSFYDHDATAVKLELLDHDRISVVSGINETLVTLNDVDPGNENGNGNGTEEPEDPAEDPIRVGDITNNAETKNRYLKHLRLARVVADEQQITDPRYQQVYIDVINDDHDENVERRVFGVQTEEATGKPIDRVVQVPLFGEDGQVLRDGSGNIQTRDEKSGYMAFNTPQETKMLTSVAGYPVIEASAMVSIETILTKRLIIGDEIVTVEDEHTPGRLLTDKITYSFYKLNADGTKGELINSHESSTEFRDFLSKYIGNEAHGLIRVESTAEFQVQDVEDGQRVGEPRDVAETEFFDIFVVKGLHEHESDEGYSRLKFNEFMIGGTTDLEEKPRNARGYQAFADTIDNDGIPDYLETYHNFIQKDATESWVGHSIVGNQIKNVFFKQDTLEHNTHILPLGVKAHQIIAGNRHTNLRVGDMVLLEKGFNLRTPVLESVSPDNAVSKVIDIWARYIPQEIAKVDSGKTNTVFENTNTVSFALPLLGSQKARGLSAVNLDGTRMQNVTMKYANTATMPMADSAEFLTLGELQASQTLNGGVNLNAEAKYVLVTMTPAEHELYEMDAKDIAAPFTGYIASDVKTIADMYISDKEFDFVPGQIRDDIKVDVENAIDVLTYTWSVNEDPTNSITLVNADQETVKVILAENADATKKYSLKLHVSEANTLRENEDIIPIIIQDTPAVLPTIIAAAENASPKAGEEVVLNATVNNLSEGATVAYTWKVVEGLEIIEGENAAQAKVKVAAEAAEGATFNATVTVTIDGKAVEKVVTLTVPKADEPQKPMLTAKTDKAAPKAGEKVKLSANVANAPKGAEFTYKWELPEGLTIVEGEGTAEVTVEVSKEAKAGAELEAKVTATAGDLNYIKTIKLTVAEAKAPKPKTPTPTTKAKKNDDSGSMFGMFGALLALVGLRRRRS